MKIWYVHGAGASLTSFSWLFPRLPKHEASFFSYTINESAADVAAGLYDRLNEPCVLLGHSLGGIIATTCADHPNVEKLITLCAPYGGVRHADFMAMFSFEPLFHDLCFHGPLLRSARNKIIEKPHLAIVGSSGLPFTSEANDGVLTVRSQMATEKTFYKLLPINHFEVLLDQQVVDLITAFL